MHFSSRSDLIQCGVTPAHNRDNNLYGNTRQREGIFLELLFNIIIRSFHVKDVTKKSHASKNLLRNALKPRRSEISESDSLPSPVFFFFKKEDHMSILKVSTHTHYNIFGVFSKGSLPVVATTRIEFFESPLIAVAADVAAEVVAIVVVAAETAAAAAAAAVTADAAAAAMAACAESGAADGVVAAAADDTAAAAAAGCVGIGGSVAPAAAVFVVVRAVAVAAAEIVVVAAAGVVVAADAEPTSADLSSVSRYTCAAGCPHELLFESPNSVQLALPASRGYQTLFEPQ